MDHVMVVDIDVHFYKRLPYVLLSKNTAGMPFFTFQN